MPEPMIVEASYNTLLVGLSVVVAVFGSFTSLQLMQAIKIKDAESKTSWIIAAALALGGGAIWTMHFIGMIAYETEMQMRFAPLMTLGSLVLAITVVAVGLFILSKNPNSIGRLFIAGVITGLGIASMHYAGMEAMIMAGEMSYDTALFAASIGIALVAATTALWLAFNLEQTWQMLLASVVMGIGVCGMHYTGMAAMTMTHEPVATGAALKPLTLGLIIFGFSMMGLLISLGVSLSQLQKHVYD